MKKIKINKDSCIGCGTCLALAGKSFKVDDGTYKAETIEPVGDEETNIQEAIDSCPVSAIKWEEE